MWQDKREEDLLTVVSAPGLLFGNGQAQNAAQQRLQAMGGQQRRALEQRAFEQITPKETRYERIKREADERREAAGYLPLASRE